MNGDFYLIGFCHLRGTVLTFAMDRILSIQLLTEPYVVPEDFFMNYYPQKAFHVMIGKLERVMVWFRKEAPQL